MDEAVSALCQYLPFFGTTELPGNDGLHFYRALPCLVNESVACEDADFTLPLLVIVESNCWICQSCYMDYPKLIYGFVTTVPCISRPLPNKTKLKFDHNFKTFEAFALK